jgi:hypothetical protein
VIQEQSQPAPINDCQGHVAHAGKWTTIDLHSTRESRIIEPCLLGFVMHQDVGPWIVVVPTRKELAMAGACYAKFTQLRSKIFQQPGISLDCVLTKRQVTAVGRRARQTKRLVSASTEENVDCPVELNARYDRFC